MCRSVPLTYPGFARTSAPLWFDFVCTPCVVRGRLLAGAARGREELEGEVDGTHHGRAYTVRANKTTAEQLAHCG